jgi:hypothetical protein
MRNKATLAPGRALAFQWLDSARILPTRAVQLGAETSERSLQHTDDFGLLIGILKNNLGFVPSDLVDTVTTLLDLANSATAKRRAVKSAKRSSRYSTTLEPLFRVLPKYISEKMHGIHQYSDGDDFDIALFQDWLRSKNLHDPPNQDIQVIATGDYIRLIARAIDALPNIPFHAGGFRSTSTDIVGSREASLDKKQLVKVLKKLSKAAGDSSLFSSDHQDIALFLAKGRIIARPLSFVTGARWPLSKDEGNETLAYGAAYNLLSEDSPIHEGQDVLNYFEELLNSPAAKEEAFQRFFEENPKFLLGTDYRALISHPILMRDDEDSLIPDFILIPYAFAQPKIVELKRPQVGLVRHKANRDGFLQSVMEARDQLLEYQTYFSSRHAAEEARERFGCDLYLPKMSLIIGRSSDFYDEYERRKAESRIPDVEILTYDDVLSRARVCHNLWTRDLAVSFGR